MVRCNESTIKVFTCGQERQDEFKISDEDENLVIRVTLATCGPTVARRIFAELGDRVEFFHYEAERALRCCGNIHQIGVVPTGRHRLSLSARALWADPQAFEVVDVVLSIFDAKLPV